MKEYKNYRSKRKYRQGEIDKSTAAFIFGASFWIIIWVGILMILSIWANA